MKSTLAKIALALAILIGGLVVAIAMQPNTFHVERSATIAATPDAVFPYVNDFRRWNDWSPWAKVDPNCKFEFAGSESGKGAIFRWDGNDEVGTGSMEIIESEPGKLVKIRLDFVKPFADTSITELALAPESDQTRVTWNMHGENTFIAKAFCLLMDMEGMIGNKYDEGLANLKRAVEAEPAANSAAADAPQDAETSDNK